MPIGWQAKTDRIQELIAEEQARLDAIQAKKQWLSQPISRPQVVAQPMPVSRPLSQQTFPVSPYYTPPQLPDTGNIIPNNEQQWQSENISQSPSLPVSADYTSPSIDPSLLQRGINAFTAPFNWVSKNITEPFGAIATSPFTSPEGLTRLPGESWLDFEKRQYERLNPLLRFGIESVPWFLIPGAGQVGTATRAGAGIAGALGKVGAVGKVLGKAVELSPWGLAEKATGKVASAVLGKRLEIPTPVNPVVAELTDLIKKFRPSTGETLKLQHVARQQQTAIIANIFQTKQPGEAFKMAKGVLKGSLPTAIPPEFAQMTPAKIETLQGLIQNFPSWERLPFNKVATEDALIGLLKGGIIPTRSETQLLETVFGSEMVKAILAKRNLGTKIFDATMDAAGLPKALVSSLDISAPGRQGILLAGEGSWWKSWKPMMQALLSDKNTAAINDSILNHPLAKYQQTAQLYLAPLNRASAGLSQFEEAFMSRLANKLPWVKASNRAYSTFLNKLRSDTFNSYVGKWLNELPEEEVITKASKLADFINKATGRGNLYGLERSGRMQEVLNASFFSPRFVMSRIQSPFTIFEKDPTVRKVIAKNLATFVGGGMGILTLAKLGGAKVELDPRSTDFGKMRIGHTRLDFWGGFQPLARYTAQFIAEERKTASGAIMPTARLDTMGRFIQSKLSPTAGLILDALKGHNFIGEPTEFTSETLKREAYGRLTPMFLQDLIDATREQGLLGTGLALPSAIGGNVNTYPVADPTDRKAQELYGQPFEALSPAQKSDIRNMPEVRANLRPTKEEAKSYKMYDQQIEDDQAFQSGRLDNKQWRDRLSERMAIRSALRTQFEGEYPEPITPEQKAQAGYYAIFDKLPENAMPDEIRVAMQEADAYMATLPPELAQYVNDNRWTNSTPLMKEFKQASLVLKPYWTVADTVARLFGQRFADSNAGQALISKRRKQIRLSNPAIARAYAQFYASK